jgi:hypothetical protein
LKIFADVFLFWFWLVWCFLIYFWDCVCFVILWVNYIKSSHMLHAFNSCKRRSFSHKTTTIIWKFTVFFCIIEQKITFHIWRLFLFYHEPIQRSKCFSDPSLCKINNITTLPMWKQISYHPQWFPSQITLFLTFHLKQASSLMHSFLLWPMQIWPKHMVHLACEIMRNTNMSKVKSHFIFRVAPLCIVFRLCD